MERYLNTLCLYLGDPVHTCSEEFDKMVVVLQRERLYPMVIVDYAKHVPSPEPAILGREQHFNYVVHSLKVLAMHRCVSVVASSAVDEQTAQDRPLSRTPGRGKRFLSQQARET